MTTDPGRPRAKRKRPHPAAGARLVVAGAATAGTLAMVGLMVSPADEPAPLDLSTASPATVSVPAPARIVIVRRHHPVPTAAPTSPPVVRSGATPALTPVPAPAPAPAPRPAAPRTTSSGS